MVGAAAAAAEVGTGAAARSAACDLDRMIGSETELTGPMSGNEDKVYSAHSVVSTI